MLASSKPGQARPGGKEISLEQNSVRGKEKKPFLVFFCFFSCLHFPFLNLLLLLLLLLHTTTISLIKESGGKQEGRGGAVSSQNHGGGNEEERLW